MSSTEATIVEEPKKLKVRKSDLRSIMRVANDMAKIKKFVAEVLKKDVDYGMKRGTENMYLLKPGALKFAKLFKVRPVYESREERLRNGEHIDVVTRVTFKSVSTGEEVDVSPYCSCSTMETAYRYKWAQPICPQCASRDIACTMCHGTGVFIPTREKCAELVAMGMGKWQQDKRGDVIVGYLWLQRLDHPNVHDQFNPVRQQSCKRAFVNGIRQLGCLNQLFVEDPSEWQFEVDVIDAEVKKAQEPKPSGRLIRDGEEELAKN